jgi:hypothetical protein
LRGRSARAVLSPSALLGHRSAPDRGAGRPLEDSRRIRFRMSGSWSSWSQMSRRRLALRRLGTWAMIASASESYTIDCRRSREPCNSTARSPRSAIRATITVATVAMAAARTCPQSGSWFLNPANLRHGGSASDSDREQPQPSQTTRRRVQTPYLAPHQAQIARTRHRTEDR